MIPSTKTTTDKKRTKLIVFVGIAVALNWLVAPWVWPAGALLAVSAAMIIQYAWRGYFILPGFAGIVLGTAGCFLTLPHTSLHSFLTKANWSHVQNLPILSIYSVALLLIAITAFSYGCWRGRFKRRSRNLNRYFVEGLAKKRAGGEKAIAER